MCTRLFFGSLFLVAQLHAQGGIQINEGPEIGALMSAWVNANHQNPKIDGWRVQILSTTDRQLAEQARIKFNNLFPGMYADWTHEKPYYKLRVGAYRTRRAAQSFVLELMEYYPGCYPAKDINIHPKDFLLQQ